MASVVKKGDVFYAVVTSNGRQRWHRAGTCPRAAKALALRLESEKLSGVAAGASSVNEVGVRYRADAVRRTVSDLIDDYQTHLQAAGRHPVHVATTIKNCRAMFRFADVDQADRLTLNHVDRYVLHLKREGLASRTINYRVGAVQALLKWMHERGLLARYVLHRYPKQRLVGVDKLKRRALTSEEIAKLLICKSVPEPRRAAYKAAVLTGLRWSELMALSASWIDWNANVLTVPATVAKAKRAQTIPLHPDLIGPVKALAEESTTDSPLLAGFLGSRTRAARVLRSDCKAAGIDVKYVQFHSLRHTFCTLLAMANVHPAVLQALARHASLETTLKYYVHMRRVDEAAAVAGLRFESIE